jgi:hypothetical protein
MPLIASISHSALSHLTSSHNDPKDQPYVHTIQLAYTSVQMVLIASEEAYCTICLHLSEPQGKKRGNKCKVI